MGPLLHTKDEGTVKTMDWRWRIVAKESEDSSNFRQGHDISFLRYTWHNFQWSSSKRKKKSTASIMRSYYGVWEMKSRKNVHIWRKRKCCFIKTKKKKNKKKITLRCMVIGTCAVQFLHYIPLYRNTQHYATHNCSVKTSLHAGCTYKFLQESSMPHY